MVKLEPVEDEHFSAQQTGPKAEEDEGDFTDTDSEVSDSDSEEEVGFEESLGDRLAALRDMLPPKQRAALSSTLSRSSSWLKTGLSWSGKSLWVISTSALLLGVPWAVAFQEELALTEMEKEQKMQQSANEMLAPGANQAPQGAGASL